MVVVISVLYPNFFFLPEYIFFLCSLSAGRVTGVIVPSIINFFRGLSVQCPPEVFFELLPQFVLQ